MLFKLRLSAYAFALLLSPPPTIRKDQSFLTEETNLSFFEKNLSDQHKGPPLIWIQTILD